MAGNSAIQAAPKQRTAFYDNLKFVLIALVLVGHFTGPFLDGCFELKVFWRTIYLFHMPAFLFVGGMFAKKLYTPQNGLRVNVIAFYVLMGILFYTGLWLEKHLWEENPVYDLFMMNCIPWYFFAMAALGAATPIVAKIKGGAKTVLPVLVALAVIVPFNNRFDDFLVLGRIFAYAPFYFAGYFLSIKGYDEWVKRQRARIWPAVCAALCFVALYAALYFLPKPISGTMSGLGTGHNTYEAMKSFPSHIDALIRLLDIGIASIMIVAVSLLTPTKHCLITDLGSRTLQVYVFHPFIYYIPEGLHLYDPIMPYAPVAGWVVAGAAVLLAFLLAWPKWPERMFRALREAINIDNANQHSQ